MFPLPFNIPFRKKDGTLSTLGDELTNGGGGGSYTLPTASADVKGGVKIGEGLTMDGEVLKNTNPTPATPYTLPTASSDVLGGVKVGSGLSINESGVLSASGGGGGGGTGVTHIDRLSSSGTLSNNSWEYTFTKRGFLLLRFDGYADATQAIQPRMYLNNSNDLFKTSYTEYPNIAKGGSVFITLPVNSGDKFSIGYASNLRNFSAQFLDLDYVSPT